MDNSIPVGEAEETSPLLRHPAAVQDSPENSYESVRSRWYPYATILVGLFSLVADLGGSLVDAPEIRLLEMAVCRDYYRTHNPRIIGPPPWSYVDEENCKVHTIQSKLAYLRATKFFISLIPGVLLTFFYGKLSDRIGRKPVLLLGMTGQTFPTNAVLASPIFLFIGGGVRVLTAVMNTIVIDVTPKEMRTTVFYLIGAAVLITDIVALPIGSWLLAKDLWLPWKFSTPIILLAYPIIIAMPETLQPVPGDLSSDNTTIDGSHTRNRQCGISFSTLAQKIKSFFIEKAESAAISKEVTICLLMIFISTFSRQAQGNFVQYTSKVLHWSISKAGYILSVQAFVALAILLGLAGTNKLLNTKGNVRSLQVDLYVIRSSFVFFSAGNTLIGLARAASPLIAGKILSAAGTPSVQAMQGIIASYAGEAVTGQLYASVAFVELIGGLGGNFAFAGLFDAGLALEDSGGIGLPFLISAVVFVFPLLLSFALPSKKAERAQTSAR